MSIETSSVNKSLELFDAIEQGDFGRVWNLVKAGKGLEYEDPESGLTPLALAAEMGRVEVVRILLDAEVDPNWGGSVTPLEAAVLEGNPAIVDLLLEAGADVNKPVDEGFTPLMSAVTIGNARIVRKLLDAGAKTRVKNADGDTAADLAEAAGYDSLVEILHGHRAKPEPVPEQFLKPLDLPKSKDDDRFDTPILGDVKSEPAEKPQQRIEKAAKWVRPDEEQVAAALASVAEEIEDPVEEPKDARKRQAATPELEGIERFHALLQVGDWTEALRMVEKQQVGVEERDRAGRTALMLASAHGACRIAEVLITEGAEVNAHDGGQSKETALIKGIRYEGQGRKELVRMLVDAGSELDHRHGPKLMTPLMEAAKVDVYGDVGTPTDFAPVTRLLIDLGADLQAQDAEGNTVWQIIKRSAMAALTSSPYRRKLHQMIRVLESAGADQMAGRI